MARQRLHTAGQNIAVGRKRYLDRILFEGPVEGF